MGWAHHILSIETFIDENEPLMWRHSGSNLTGPLMVTPLLRFLSRHCWGPPSDNKTLQFRDSSCKLWIREKGLIFLISRQTLSLSPAPPGDKISDHWARRDEIDHRQRRDKVSRVTDFLRIFRPPPDQTQNCIFLWRMKQFGARKFVLLEWNSEGEWSENSNNEKNYSR